VSKLDKLHEMIVYLIFFTYYEYYFGIVVTVMGTYLTTYLIMG